MTDAFPNATSTVGDNDLLDAIKRDPANALVAITAYRMEQTLSWVGQYIEMRDRAVAAEGKHGKLLIALKGQESALKKLGEEHK